MVIPHPARLTRHAGSFTPTGVQIGPGTHGPARLLAEYADLPVVHSGPAIRLALAPGFGPEEYALDVTMREANLTASTEAGLLAGVQTVRQLLPRLECLTIRDAPRLPWRGVLLDVARHFLPLEFLREFVDLLALHKYNVLHLHLTDDQGWRIEIDGWPRLTEVGAWRAESMVGAAGSGVFDGVPHGGFYTRRELRELVAFAAARGVRVVPEIDLPGHVRAALAAYPELGNRPGVRLPVWTEWGISPDILGVHDGAFAFCEDVLTQVADVFPAPYLHIGGDECPTTQWAENPVARAKAAALGLGSTAELHPWFLGELHRVVAGLGRQAVCWDETGHAAGRLPAELVVTAWRDAAHGELAVARGHQVVMAPHLSTYFDYRQTEEPGEPPREPITTLEDVYRFDPLAGGLPVSDGTRPGVLGTQAQLWTEHAPTPDHVRHLAFPRLCALAERAWSPPGRGYADFHQRLAGHLTRLRALGALPKERVRFAGAVPVPEKTVP
ncbi:beta-N-acetylhexosaminidase [Amycolatopsis sp. FBCC-B4732]|uniref:beta-N-acetylhexosaminidase n=1 Tax=Amycolatopsis sp. FBCC-B4732 TaxID=3079339 RepID=UPI001FF455A0|nr:beta-N-acetylhexosaminidase [Amycolatopsis sp. FBCC-B4732]UOX92601.1 beta-N-acetylhexosaminidase [Amycolatopsis sp. FBCC-B4732]